MAGCQVLRPTPEALAPLRFVVHPHEEDSVAHEQFRPLIEFLSEELDREVELTFAADFTAVIEAMKYNHADIARFAPFSYVLATQEADVEVIVSDIKKKSGKASYQGLIIARTDRNITDLNGKSFAFVDIGSTSGYLIPATYVEKNGIELGETFFAGSHPAVIQAVKNGTVDAGAIADNRLYTALEEGILEEGEITVFWTSAPMPSSPIAVQTSLDTALKNAIRQAFLDAPLEVMECLGLNTIGFEEMKDSDYDVVREIQETLELD